MSLNKWFTRRGLRIVYTVWHLFIHREQKNNRLPCSLNRKSVTLEYNSVSNARCCLCWSLFPLSSKNKQGAVLEHQRSNSFHFFTHWHTASKKITFGRLYGRKSSILSKPSYATASAPIVGPAESTSNV